MRPELEPARASGAALATVGFLGNHLVALVALREFIRGFDVTTIPSQRTTARAIASSAPVIVLEPPRFSREKFGRPRIFGWSVGGGWQRKPDMSAPYCI